MNIRGNSASDDDAWQEVTKAEPCPVCKHGTWCRRSPDGNKVACRREPNGAKKRSDTKTGRSVPARFAGRRPGGRQRQARRQRPASTRPTPQPSGDGRQAGPGDRRGNTRPCLSAFVGRRCPVADHRDDLQRGLTDADIDAGGYRTLPENTDGRWPSGCCRGWAAIHRQGARFRSSGGPRIAAPAGLLVPVRDLQGRIVAVTSAARQPRRRWQVSVAVIAVDQVPGGPSPGSPAHVPAGVVGPCEVVRITEGELKADVAYRLSGVPTVSFPGVASWRTVLPVLQALQAKTVRVAFDADADDNAHVARPCGIASRNCRPTATRSNWNGGRRTPARVLTTFCRPGGGNIEILAGPAALQAAEQIAAAAGVDDSDAGSEGKRHRKSQSTLLVELAAVAELWHTPGRDAYATLPVADIANTGPSEPDVSAVAWPGNSSWNIGKAPERRPCRML